MTSWCTDMVEKEIANNLQETGQIVMINHTKAMLSSSSINLKHTSNIQIT
uniref:Uncharacterized protein n=1 Tax=Arion vulgaris TaxID=1028688 RepID=A0A0B7BP78_9EUPU